MAPRVGNIRPSAQPLRVVGQVLDVAALAEGGAHPMDVLDGHHEGE